MKNCRVKIFCYNIFVVLLILISVLVVGCSPKEYNWQNHIENYDMEDIEYLFLEKGESVTFNYTEHFADTPITIDKFEARSSDESVFTVSGNTITAVGIGRATMPVNLYSKAENTYYYTTAATIYVTAKEDTRLTEIDSAQDLADIRKDLDGYYILKNNIDLSEWGDWNPIGNLPLEEESVLPGNNAFRGVFINPYGYTIKNLTISSSENIPHGLYGGCHGGLFGDIKDAYIDGLILKNVQIDLSDFEGGRSSAGGITASSLNSVIRNCNVTGRIVSQDSSGGIDGGASWGRLIGCRFKGTVVSTENGAGGIAGFGYIVQDCSVDATVQGAFSAGGILGLVTTPTHFIVNCNFTGELLSDGMTNESVGYDPYSRYK